jgi:hypothetical protein
MMFLILSLNFVVYFPILMPVDILYMLIIYPPRSVYDSISERRQRAGKKDQVRREKFRKAIDVHTVFPCRRAVTTTIIQVFIAGISVQKERG